MWVGAEVEKILHDPEARGFQGSCDANPLDTGGAIVNRIFAAKPSVLEAIAEVPKRDERLTLEKARPRFVGWRTSACVWRTTASVCFGGSMALRTAKEPSRSAPPKPVATASRRLDHAGVECVLRQAKAPER
jgi:hypothetical protein